MNPEEILKRFKQLVVVLEESMSLEKESKLINEYKGHIERTNNFIITINFESNSSAQIEKFYESESRSYGWSYLPNSYGEKAELEFWKLMKELGYFKGTIGKNN